jgi:3-oxoacyl-[acyl-carrier protein] reductase
LGQETAKLLARDGFLLYCGYNCSQTKAEELALKLDGKAFKISAEGDPLEALEWVFNQEGRLDAVINCVGLNIEGPAALLDFEVWRKVFDLNLHFAFHLTQAAARIMIPSGGGRIIHLSSAAARLGGRGQLNYAASKAALERLVKGFALECGPKGILINAVAPGIIVSPMTERIVSKHRQSLLERIASRRFGSPMDVAEAVAFLAGPGASYINGAVLAVDGGLW